jgi:peptide chain release factor 1
MLNKLKQTEEHYNELEKKTSDPEYMSDQKEYAKLMKEYKTLTPIVEAYREYLEQEKNFNDAKETLDGGSLDKDFRELVQAEYDEAKENIEKLSEELKILLLPKDENDDKNVIIEIRAGVGGDEAALFANSLYRMYTMYAENKRWKVEELNSNPTGLGGYKEVSFMVSGDGAYSRLKYESGVHRVQRVPETESSGRIHTSTVTVAVLPEADEVEVDINPSELKIDVFRASGAGGQHINKTESAVRITHLPTGLVVECQDERSQHKNKDRAMMILRSRLYEAKLQEHNAQIAGERKSQVGMGERSEKSRTYNYPQQRITDHRIKMDIFKFDNFMDGNIEELIDALATADRAAKLSSSEE